MITSCIRPGRVRYLAMTDADTRLRWTLCGLVAWIRTPGVAHVVFCDNSGTDFDFGGVAALASDAGVGIEFLLFNDNSLAEAYGKGAGEGLILAHVLAHSRGLDRFDAFWKITGKLHVANFPDVAEAHWADPAVFMWPAWIARPPLDLRAAGPAQGVLRWLANRTRVWGTMLVRGYDPGLNVNTRFFRVDKAFFRRHLQNAYLQVDDRRHYFLENAYGRALAGTEVVHFRVRPQVHGLSGTSNTHYAEGFPDHVRALAESLMRAGLPGGGA